MPGPKPPEIVLTDAERAELERLVRSHSTGQALARRVRVVLLADTGFSNMEIARLVPGPRPALTAANMGRSPHARARSAFLASGP